MKALEKRNAPRISAGEGSGIIVSFVCKGQEYRGELWNYSRFGLGVRIKEAPALPGEGESVQDIRVDAFGNQRDLGEGRLARSFREDSNHFFGLSLLEEFIDLDVLLEQKQFRTVSDEVSVVHAAIDAFSKVDSAIKDYAADFSAGLAVFKEEIDALDADLDSEEAPSKEGVQHALEHGIGVDLWAFMNSRIGLLEHVLAERSPEDQQLAAGYIRRILWPYLESAPFIHRVVKKPRGYAGDSMMMQMLYEDEFAGESTFAKFLHRHPLQRPSAQAVRNRRGLIISELEKYIDARKKERVNVLSVACGPAWEMKDFFESSRYVSRANLFLLDQDQEALDEARSSVVSGGGDPNTVHFIQESVKTLLRRRLPGSLKNQTFDFIYTMGLFDYLTVPVARALVTRLHDMASAGGVLYIGNYSTDCPDRHYMNHLLDWPLLYKSPEEMLSLADDLPATTERSIGYEESGVQMFLQLKK